MLRAGLGLLEAVTDLYPDAVVGYLGMERDEETHEPRDYYAKLPRWRGATRSWSTRCWPPAGAGSAAVAYVKARAAPTDISFVCVVAAPGGRRAAARPTTPTCRSWSRRPSTAS